MADQEKILLNGEYAGAGLWTKEFEKDGVVTKTLSGSIKLDKALPEGEYWVNIYKNENAKSETAPAFNLYLKPKEASAPAKKEVADDDVF